MSDFPMTAPVLDEDDIWVGVPERWGWNVSIPRGLFFDPDTWERLYGWRPETDEEISEDT